MTVTVTPLLSGKLDQRHGKGPKILLANVTLEPSVEALHPSSKYLDMKTIKAVFVQGSPTFGSASMGILVNLVAPGSVANYASFNVYRIVSGTTVAGSPQGYAMRYIAKTGTITSTMLVVGE